jgi:hypothetical protein
MTSLVHQHPELPTVGCDAEISDIQFRRATGHLPTGVAAVAALVDGAPVGTAINGHSIPATDKQLRTTR